MEMSTGRRTLTLALVVGAMLLGMLLIGGVDLVTPRALAEPQDEAPPVAVAPAAPGALPSFADLAEAVSPAVAAIQVTKIEHGNQRRGLDPFEFFLPRQRRERQEPEEYRSDSSGSGFVIRPRGLVVTNHHVIEDATEVTVVLGDRRYPAEVVGRDPGTDLALLQIEPDGDLPYLELGDSEALRVGDWVMAIGSPLRLDNSVSVGVVSAKGRSINITADRSLENFIQTDAAINFGNSGGPLVDLHGRVVGIATAINYGAENIGFAVPVSTLERILPQLEESGSVHRGYLGVSIDDLDHDEAEAFGLSSTDGALVTEVREDGPAKDAGVLHGDVILEVDGHKIHNNRELIDYIAAQPPGRTVSVELFRDGKTLSKKIELSERPGTDLIAAAPEAERERGIEWLGISYQDIPPNLRQYHNFPESLQGAWITRVAPSSPLYDEGVAANDVIVEVNGVAVPSADAFEREVEKVEKGKLLRLYVTRFDPSSERTASFFAIVRVP